MVDKDVVWLWMFDGNDSVCFWFMGQRCLWTEFKENIVVCF